MSTVDLMVNFAKKKTSIKACNRLQLSGRIMPLFFPIKFVSDKYRFMYSEWLLFNITWTIFSYMYIMQTSYISIRWWWCLLWIRPKCLVGFSQSNGKYVVSFVHIILFLSKLVFALIPWSCVLKQWPRRSSKYQFYSLWLGPTRLEHTIYRSRDDHATHYTSNAAMLFVFNYNNISVL